jgi:hypothetical protein
LKQLKSFTIVKLGVLEGLLARIAKRLVQEEINQFYPDLLKYISMALLV